MTTHAAAAAATVLGQLVLSGGPRNVHVPPGRDFPIAVMRTGMPTRHIHTDSRGGFSLHLSPGTYRIVARETYAPMRDCPAVTVRLAAHRTVHVQLSCSIR